MEFSKENIASKHFSKKMFGGLDEFEVRDFLYVLAEEIRRLTQTLKMQEQKLEDQEALIKDYKDREHILKESIVGAEKWAKKIQQDAEQGSHLILSKAHDKSESMIKEARHSLQNVYNDIAHLKRLQLQFKTGLKAALQVQMDLLDQDPMFNSSASLAEGGPVESLLKAPDAEQLKQKIQEGPEAKPSLQKASTSDEELSSLKESLNRINKNFT